MCPQVASLQSQIQSQEADIQGQEAALGEAREELGRLQHEETRLEQSVCAGRTRLDAVTRSLKATQEEISQVGWWWGGGAKGLDLT